MLVKPQAVQQSSTDSCTLVVFCKRPGLGQGKQRLAKTIGARKALQVAKILLDCALEDAHCWQQTTNNLVVLSPASEQDVSWAQSLYPDALVTPQTEGNLGQRLNAVDKQLRQQGHQQLIYIGTDAPLLQVDDLLIAAQGLDNHEVVLQPAGDGGVILMSANMAWPQLATLPWSLAGLQQALSAVCLIAGCSVWLMPGGEDVDNWPGLTTMLPKLQNDPRAARQRLAQYVTEINL